MQVHKRWGGTKNWFDGEGEAWPGLSELAKSQKTWTRLICRGAFVHPLQYSVDTRLIGNLNPTDTQPRFLLHNSETRMIALQSNRRLNSLPPLDLRLECLWFFFGASKGAEGFQRNFGCCGARVSSGNFESGVLQATRLTTSCTS
ncbi:predicted protein [Coccidioides posadasii str. Silveira]|uniref:Predicted protein n=2 Tax=Coccidioides posadasii TaxID=199306 RepID=E9D9W4_COCPS|nr:predicted protein [Coccidioides posadasii str. Silveira]KMM64540.1 hypothetical protein CPAG_00892 [Coccidioides posadasii RMSCC 3488]